MAVQVGGGTRGTGFVELALDLAAAMKGAVLGSHTLALRTLLALAGLAQVDDFGHGYFLRKASRETTSAPLVSGLAV